MRKQFCVFIVESPTTADIFNRISEADTIQRAVILNNVPCVIKTAISRLAFEAALKIGLPDAMRQHQGYTPVVYLSAQGTERGIVLSTGEVISWKTLESYLRPVNAALEHRLIVCMSNATGYAAKTMGLQAQDEDLPYLALISCSEKPTWAEMVVGYTTFFHQLYLGASIESAVQIMRAASGNHHFTLSHAEKLLGTATIRYEPGTDSRDAQEKLEHRLEDETAEHLQSLRKQV